MDKPSDRKYHVIINKEFNTIRQTTEDYYCVRTYEHLYIKCVFIFKKLNNCFVAYLYFTR